MADIATPLLAGLIGGTFSGSLSGVLVFEYQTRRRRQLDLSDARNTTVALLEQVILLSNGQSPRLAATRRRALQDLLGELARAVPPLAGGLSGPSRQAFQAILVQLGDAVATPGTSRGLITSLAVEGVDLLRT